MAKHKQTRSELLENIRLQYEFLKRGIESWDSGFEGEAIRLSTTLRVLLHESGSSHSLLRQLGHENEYFLDTRSRHRPGNLLGFHGLVLMQVQAQGGQSQGVTWKLDLSSGSVDAEQETGDPSTTPNVTWKPRYD